MRAAYVAVYLLAMMCVGARAQPPALSLTPGLLQPPTMMQPMPTLDPSLPAPRLQYAPASPNDFMPTSESDALVSRLPPTASPYPVVPAQRSEEHTSELQSLRHL